MYRLPIAMVSLILTGCASAKIEVWLWSDAQAPIDFNENSPIQPHPCGTIEKKFVNTLPSEGRPGFERGSELVVEFNSKGEIIRRWNTPMEPDVLAINGDIITLSYSVSALTVSTSGKLKLVPQVQSQSEYNPACPIRELGNEYSNFGCYELKNNNEIHLLAYRLVCT